MLVSPVPKARKYRLSHISNNCTAGTMGHSDLAKQSICSKAVVNQEIIIHIWWDPQLSPILAKWQTVCRDSLTLQKTVMFSAHWIINSMSGKQSSCMENSVCSLPK